MAVIWNLQESCTNPTALIFTHPTVAYGHFFFAIDPSFDPQWIERTIDRSIDGSNHQSIDRYQKVLFVWWYKQWWAGLLQSSSWVGLITLVNSEKATSACFTIMALHKQKGVEQDGTEKTGMDWTGAEWNVTELALDFTKGCWRQQLCVKSNASRVCLLFVVSSSPWFCSYFGAGSKSILVLNKT